MMIACLAVVSSVTVLWATNALEGKWLIAALVGLSAVWAILLSRDVEYALLLVFVVLFPVNPDVHFGYDPEPWGAGVISLSGCDLALAGLYGLWLVRLLGSRAESGRIRLFPSISLPFGLLLFWHGVSALRAVDPILALCGLIPLVKTWLAFFYFANNIRQKRQLVGLGLALSAGILLQGPVAFAQYFLGTTFNLQVFGETRHSVLVQEIGAGELSRVGGTLGHPNGLAYFLVSILPLVIALGVAGLSRLLSLTAILAFVLGVASLVLTFSRAGWIGFAAVMPAVLLLGAWKRGGLGRAVAALGLFGIAVGAVALPFSDRIAQRLFEEDYGMAWARVPQMQVAWNVVRSHPILGVGFNNYKLVMDQYDNTLERITVHVRNPVHNMFLLLTAEVGIPGLIFLLWLLAVLVGFAWRGFRWKSGPTAFLCLGVLGGMAGYTIHSLVNFNTLSSMYFFGLFMGLIGASQVWSEARHAAVPEPVAQEKPHRLRRVVRESAGGALSSPART